MLGFLIPLMAIGLGFDAVNGEYNRRTLSRILSQPIYRDALLLGKFLAGLATLAISLTCMWLLVLGLGLLLLGVPPSGEEIARSLLFLVIALAYAGVWLAAGILCSITFRSPATAALVSLGTWLFFAVLWPLLGPAIAQVIAPPDAASILLGRPSLETLQWQQALERLSPTHLFGEGVIAILSPSTRALGPIFLEQLEGAVIGAPLPLAQSLLLAWPQTVGLLAATILLFAVAYVTFQRQEVRA
jgi:ABC-2 type transport system permease protein